VPCSHYGLLRKEQYGLDKYLFCSNCDLYDLEVSSGNACQVGIRGGTNASVSTRVTLSLHRRRM
jgi:hypothetical protein